MTRLTAFISSENHHRGAPSRWQNSRNSLCEIDAQAPRSNPKREGLIIPHTLRWKWLFSPIRLLKHSLKLFLSFPSWSAVSRTIFLALSTRGRLFKFSRLFFPILVPLWENVQSSLYPSLFRSPNQLCSLRFWHPMCCLILRPLPIWKNKGQQLIWWPQWPAILLRKSRPCWATLYQESCRRSRSQMMNCEKVLFR